MAQSVFDMHPVAGQPRWLTKGAEILDGTYMTILVVLCTFLAIFLDDLRLAVFPISADETCWIIAAVVLGVFVVDTLAGSIVRAGYFMRLYW